MKKDICSAETFDPDYIVPIVGGDATSEVERRHLDHLRRKNLSPRTRRDREGVLRRLTEYLDCPLLEATPDDLERWQAGLRVSISAISTYTGLQHPQCGTQVSQASLALGGDLLNGRTLSTLNRQLSLKLYDTLS